MHYPVLSNEMPLLFGGVCRLEMHSYLFIYFNMVYVTVA
jgi:hypothetical protein